MRIEGPFAREDHRRTEGDEQKTFNAKHHEQEPGGNHRQRARRRQGRIVCLAVCEPGQEKHGEDDEAGFHSVCEPANPHRTEQAQQHSIGQGLDRERGAGAQRKGRDGEDQCEIAHHGNGFRQQGAGSQAAQKCKQSNIGET